MATHPTRTVVGATSFLSVRAVTLRVTKGPDAGRSVTVDQPSFVVGVGSGADFRLTDPAVSREHLRFLLAPNGVRVVDNGSKNGTSIGGGLIHDLTLTRDTSLVLGSTTLSVTLEAAPLELPLSHNDRFGDALGTSPAMRHLFALLEKAAASDLSILLEGESGVGKDVLARAVHAASPRRDGPFVVTDCSAIPANLIESELFGHERGAFTGAAKARKGLLEQADGGTLFLDEIGELPLDMQPKLLRVLEQREVKPVGGNETRKVDVRVVAATNRRLSEASRTGEFRSDLFYRIAVVRMTVPPLRERREDIMLIARAMLRMLKHDPQAELPPETAAMLMAYSWPGNVRELRNVIERHAALGAGSEGIFENADAVRMSANAELALLPFHEARKIVLDRFEDAYLTHLLERAGGVVSRAADMAGVARPSLYRMIERIKATPREPNDD